MVSDPTNVKRATLAAFVILAVALLLRVINLDADPSAFISRDVITDEGWWAHNARNAILYSQWIMDDYNLGLYSAYLYNALLYFTFEVFGISFTTMRMLSALAGWFTVVLLFLLVRRESGARAALFAGALLGFSNLHIIYSRSGFAESTMVFFLALAFWLWSLRQKHWFFALMSGVAFALMLLTKITAIYVLPGVVLLIVAALIRRSVRRPEALYFIAGTGIVGAAYTILFIAPNFSDWLQFNLANGSGSEWAAGLSGRIHSILRLLGSSFYTGSPLVTALTLLSLYLFVVSASGNGLIKTIRAAGDMEVMSAALLTGYLFSLSFTAYQPERRFLPALFLMAILSAGILDKGWATLNELAEPDHRMSPVGWFTVLFLLPAIGILELKFRLPSVAVLWVLKGLLVSGMIAVAVALGRQRCPERIKRSLVFAARLIFILLFLALSMGLIYKAVLLWGLDTALWTATGYKTLITGSVVVLACGVVVSILVRDTHRTARLLLCGFLFIEGIQISTWLFQPTYTMKEASASLANSLTRDDTIVTYYETVLLTTGAKVICRSERRGFNADVFETGSPQYILVLRRDNWRDYALDEMPPEEWPPPVGFVPTKVAAFDLCPTRLRGPRFIVELFSLGPQVKRHKKFSAGDTQ